jgi:hypothetical protein
LRWEPSAKRTGSCSCCTCLLGLWAEEIRPQVVARYLPASRLLKINCLFDADLLRFGKEPRDVLLRAAERLGQLNLRSVGLNGPFNVGAKI